jgi:hypothetical protein
MNPENRSRACILFLGMTLTLSVSTFGVERVAVSANAEINYTQRKFDGPKVLPESYVLMEGTQVRGDTADRSIDHLPFRRIAEQLAPELARQQFWPAPDAASADLLIVVHWGTTSVRPTMAEMKGVTTFYVDEPLEKKLEQLQTIGNDPIVSAWAGMSSEFDRKLAFDQLERATGLQELAAEQARTARMLGYTQTLDQLVERSFSSDEEVGLRADMGGERYFIILRAYDLKAPLASGEKRRAVWTTHLNMRSPGRNFKTALAVMGHAGKEFFGRTTGTVQTVRARLPEGRVLLGPLEVIEEK